MHLSAFVLSLFASSVLAGGGATSTTTSAKTTTTGAQPASTSNPVVSDLPNLFKNTMPQGATAANASYFVAATSPNLGNPNLYLIRTNAATNAIMWNTTFVPPAGMLGASSSSMLAVGNTLVVLTSLRNAQNYSSLILSVAIDTGAIISQVRLPAPIYLSSNLPSTTSIALSLVTSSISGKVYALSNSIQTAAYPSSYGYTISRVNVGSASSVDWTLNFLPTPQAISGGGDINSALEVGTNLFVVGGLGVISVASSNGLVTPVTTSIVRNPYTIASITPATIVVSNNTFISAISTVAPFPVAWVVKNGAGMVQNYPGPVANSLWFNNYLTNSQGSLTAIQTGYISTVNGASTVVGSSSVTGTPFFTAQSNGNANVLIGYVSGSSALGSMTMLKYNGLTKSLLYSKTDSSAGESYAFASLNGTEFFGIGIQGGVVTFREA